ncbi:MAG: hypothetical protein SWH61_10835 [Thermodesulfobacteriota bacterium]|nr:hypothetical protein [Thermodesulfobacteriota bacterium]
MMEKKVKGTMLVDLVKTIRKNKDINWEQYFTSEEWQTINSKILDPSWYPLELYSKCGLAIYQLLAGSDVELVRSRGKSRARELFGGVYQAIVTKDDPLQALKKFVAMYRLLFNFEPLSFEVIGDNHFKLMHDFNELGKDNGKAYCSQLMGTLETLIEMSGGKKINIIMTAKQWEEDPVTIFDIQWQ